MSPSIYKSVATGVGELLRLGRNLHHRSTDEATTDLIALSEFFNDGIFIHLVVLFPHDSLMVVRVERFTDARDDLEALR